MESRGEVPTGTESKAPVTPVADPGTGPEVAAPAASAGSPTEVSAPARTEAATASPLPAHDGPALSRESAEGLFRNLLAPLGDRLESLRRGLEDQARGADRWEKVLDKLHEELQEHKNGTYFRILEPVLTDLIRLHDDLSRILTQARASGALLPGDLARSLDLFVQQILDALDRQGVVKYACTEGKFDRTNQKAVATVETTDPEQHLKVAEVIRAGFRRPEKILRFEEVRIFKHKPSQDGPPKVTGP